MNPWNASKTLRKSCAFFAPRNFQLPARALNTDSTALNDAARISGVSSFRERQTRELQCCSESQVSTASCGTRWQWYSHRRTTSADDRMSVRSTDLQISAMISVFGMAFGWFFGVDEKLLSDRRLFNNWAAKVSRDISNNTRRWCLWILPVFPCTSAESTLQNYTQDIALTRKVVISLPYHVPVLLSFSTGSQSRQGISFIHSVSCVSRPQFWHSDIAFISSRWEAMRGASCVRTQLSKLFENRAQSLYTISYFSY